jgi:hypothetical protein
MFYGIEENSLSQDWSQLVGNLWLNPPFGSIAPWAKKCRTIKFSAIIFFLTPASVGSNWFAENVHEKARVFFLSPRICFDGKNPYPKDLMLSMFGGPIGYECWRWK